jgi:hypothetical protein
MKLLRQVGATGNRICFNDMGNMVVKLLRIYAAQLEALKRYRSAGEQRVVVHQHVTVTAEQAAVQVNGGAAPDPRGEGDGSKPKERAHAPADPASPAHEPSAPMPCPDPARNTVPIAGSAGESPLPDARRG